jgi:hypothetical protein
MNGTDLRTGFCIEEYLGLYRILMEKRGADLGRLSHRVVFPPQDMAKAVVQTIDGCDRLRG